MSIIKTLFSQSTYENIALSFIWIYSHNTIMCYNYALNIYNSNSIVRCIVDYIHSSITFLHNQYTILTSNKRNEPDAKQWFCVCTLPTVDHYFEMYDMVKDITDEQKYSFAFSFSDSKTELDVITILKNDDKYKIKLFDPSMNDTVIFPDDSSFSDFEPLSITYSHPKMKTTIDLKLSKSMFITGNQLFSPIFVKRCLEYQEDDYYFDLDYVITIIDKNVQITTIRSSEYLLVNTSTISIKPIQTKVKIT